MLIALVFRKIRRQRHLWATASATNPHRPPPLCLCPVLPYSSIHFTSRYWAMFGCNLIMLLSATLRARCDIRWVRHSTLLYLYDCYRCYSRFRLVHCSHRLNEANQCPRTSNKFQAVAKQTAFFLLATPRRKPIESSTIIYAAVVYDIILFCQTRPTARRACMHNAYRHTRIHTYNHHTWCRTAVTTKILRVQPPKICCGSRCCCYSFTVPARYGLTIQFLERKVKTTSGWPRFLSSGSHLSEMALLL